MEQYHVTGMSCAACVARVEKAVTAVDGVTGCAVSLLTNSMGVEGTASADDIIAAVIAAGYGASRKSETPNHKPGSVGEDALADKLPEYMENFDMYYIPAIGMDAVTKLADYYVEHEYGQFSLFFKNDAEAKRAVNKMLEEGYIAVLSDSKYEPDPFEKFAMGFIVFLMVAIWLGGVIGLAFFIRLCQSRSIVSFKNDIAIMRSMGIKAAVIKISMYMRSVIAVIPAAAGLFAVAALIFTSPELNGYFTYLYGWQYALICLGLLLIAIRVSFKQQGKLFEGSVKKTLTGGELND